jgi:hypothetical protein
VRGSVCARVFIRSGLWTQRVTQLHERERNDEERACAPGLKLRGPHYPSSWCLVPPFQSCALSLESSIVLLDERLMRLEILGMF